MKRVLLVSVMAAAAFSVANDAGADLANLECDLLEATPLYWALYGAVVAARDTGALSSKDSCEQIGDTVNDFSIPSNTYKDCVCNAVSWPSMPTCDLPHNACTTGSALPAQTTSPGCSQDGSAVEASIVCGLDSYCCDTAWDQICLDEQTQLYWAQANSAAQSAAANPPACQLNASNAPRTPEGVAIFLQQCPNGHEQPQAAANDVLQGWTSQAAELRSEGVSCLGPHP
ncbi:MAG: hypothetical protein JOZ69_21425 [Myxococcales bacterium]|nr:hypothetical protein [Myxococcales bacterium]